MFVNQVDFETKTHSYKVLITLQEHCAPVVKLRLSSIGTQQIPDPENNYVRHNSLSH